MSEHKSLLGIAALALTIVYMVVNGWAVSVLWGWFVVPLGVPAVGIAHAIGLRCIVALCKTPKYKEPDDKHSIENSVFGIVSSVVGVGVAWIVYTAGMAP